MADIILPDDVFENMQHAQEAAEKMNAAVNDFNKKVDEKFKGEDASNKAKFKQKINPILSPDEKKRYRNIGNAFFEGAKNQIVDIFKQIEENKKKSLFSRATAAVKEKVQAIKDTVEEHKTGGKILLAIAAIGGIYVLFKDWFDKNMPEIWEKMKEAVVSFANGAVSLAEEISKVIANNDIFQTIKNFILDTGKTIAKFFKEIGDTLTGLFSGNSDSKNIPLYNVKEKTEKDIEEENKGGIIYTTVIQNADNRDLYKSLVENQNARLDIAERIDQWQHLQDEGIETYNGTNVVDELKRLREKYQKLEKAKEGISDEARFIAEQFENGIATVAKNTANNAETKKIIELWEKGDKEGATSLFLKMRHAEGIAKDIADSRELEFYEEAMDNISAFTGYSAAGLKNQKGGIRRQAVFIAEGMTETFVNQLKNVMNNNGETIEETEAERKKAEDKLRQQREETERRIQNANYAKLTHVAVITSLDEFVRNFFDGDKEGSFKHFSKTFLESIKQIGDNFKIATTIIESINSLHNKVDSLVDKVKKNLETIVEALNNDTQSVKNFISEKFEENNISYLSDRLQDIISKEQEQIDCLVEQNEILKETNTLLSNVGNKNNSFNIINPQNEGNNIDVSNMPNATTVSIANAFVTGEMPFA